MKSTAQDARRPRPLVIALRCSGGGSGQWGALAGRLEEVFDLHDPEYFGSGSVGPWTGAHAFTLADEAARSIALIDGCDADIHLVGHSYGGGVALKVALARPHRIRTLTLYEPSAFHLLLQMGGDGADAHFEITNIVELVHEGVLSGDYRGAVARFVDYWSGPGAWEAMRESTQGALIALAPKLPLDFRALLEEPTPLKDYLGFPFPVHVLRGEHAPRPTRFIAELLSQTMSRCRLSVIPGAGHMGPVTHADEVASRISDYITLGETTGARHIPASPDDARSHRKQKQEVRTE